MPREISSPFTPGIPVPAEFFVGRSPELERLRTKLRNAASGRVEVAFLVGERGIGKSSLASFARILFERHDQALGVHTFLGGVATLGDMARAVFDRLLKVGVGTAWFEKIKGFFGKHIKSVDLFGVNFEFVPPERELQSLVRNFSTALRNVFERIQDEKRVLFLVLDDINGLASSAEFAHWLKSLVDEIATSQQPLPLFILLVGVEERRQDLIRLQPSLARVFDVVDMRAWSAAETREFFQRAFTKAGMALDPQALTLFVDYAGGLPVFAHELGDAAFNLDGDQRVDILDADQAISNAAAIIGRKYLEPQVVQALRSKRYRSILRKLARDMTAVAFQRSDVMQQLAAEEQRVFDNFLRRMSKLGVISRDADEGPGAYRFTKLLHHAYFWMEAERRNDHK